MESSTHHTKTTGEKLEDLGKKACTKASDTSHKVCDASCSGTEALKAKGSEVSHGVKSDIAMEKAKDPNRPLTERAAEGLSGVKEKVSEMFSGGSKEAHKEAAKSHIKE
jgi:hypothetical protein